MDDAEPPRLLTPEEEELLRWMIEHGNPGADTFAPQIKQVRVTRWCSCGCPSLALHAEEGTPPGTSRSSVVADVIGRTSDDKQVGLILFQKKGLLSVLDVHAAGWSVEGAFGLPALDKLRTWEDLGRFDTRIWQQVHSCASCAPKTK